MTKRELLATLQSELNRHGMDRIDNINANSTKSSIQHAIDCLQTPDETLDNYLDVFRCRYPHMADTIAANGRDWKRHYFNRYYVFCNARMFLNETA